VEPTHWGALKLAPSDEHGGPISLHSKVSIDNQFARLRIKLAAFEALIPLSWPPNGMDSERKLAPGSQSSWPGLGPNWVSLRASCPPLGPARAPKKRPPQRRDDGGQWLAGARRKSLLRKVKVDVLVSEAPSRLVQTVGPTPLPQAAQRSSIRGLECP